MPRKSNNQKAIEYNRAAKEEALIRARRGEILPFTKLTFPGYQISWHHRLMGQYLNDFLAKKIRRLMVFMPPRHGKSEKTSRRLPAMIHGLYPNDEVMAASYSAELASDMTVDVQRIMDHPAYHEIFPRSRIVPEGTTSKYTRSKKEHELIPIELPDKQFWIPRGSYRSAGVGGAFTGRGADWLLIDDPLKNREEADSKTIRDGVFKWYQSSARTRMEGEGSILITMTRWHPDDLAGRLLELAKSDPEADQWVVLSLPAIKDKEADYDPRELGEALWPEKFPTSALSKLKASGEREWQSLYQQNPTNPEGSLIKREWFKFFKEPPKMDIEIQSWDFAVKDKDGADYTVGLVIGRKGVDKFVLDMVRARMNFPAACQSVVTLSGKWPKTYKKLIEDKANGPAVLDTLKKRVAGLVAVEPNGDKVARLNAVAPDVESGNVYLPDPSTAPWVHTFIQEVCDFPNATHDDIVDAFSQGLFELRKSGPVYAPIAGHGTGLVYT